MPQGGKASKSRQAGITPLPAVFDRPDDPADAQAQAWSFEESEQGTTDLAHRHMTLPMGEDDQSFGVRSHEMLHAALSPYPSGAMDVCTLSAEDGRIESVATARGIQRTVPIDSTAFLAELLGKGDLPAAITCAVALTGAPQERQERDALARLGTPEAAELLDLMDWAAGQYAADPSWRSTEIVADRLREILGTSEPPPPGESGEDDSSEDSGSGKGEGEGKSSPESEGESSSPGKPSRKSGAGLAKAIAGKPRGTGSEPGVPGAHGVRIPRPPKPAESEDDPASKVAERKMDPTAQPGRPEEVYPVDLEALAEWIPIVPDRWAVPGKWGKPRMDYPSRPVVLVQREHGHKRSRATDYGTVPARMHRMTIDQKVFSSRKHKRQGTVLVDQSGSMYITAAQIRQLIDYAPAVTVAGYWGHGNGTGMIRVLAAGGRMVDDDDLQPDGGMNEIDLPALAWLAAQRGPRVWVCDGHITTSGDHRAGIIYTGEQLAEWRNSGSHTEADIRSILARADRSEHVRHCKRVMQKARIVHVRKLTEVIKYLR